MDISEATRLMEAFAERTGLSSDEPPKRYLWTDAFAVCNFLSMAHRLDDLGYMELGRHTVRQVHQVLGKHRDDDPREGWISGLDDDAGEEHPTRGGLRIGKPLPDGGPEERRDPRQEWDRDGQYFHYLTKWMIALDRMSEVTGAPKFNRWARELAQTAHRAFIYRPDRGGRPRMYWKMSVDLRRPLVTSMGQHDPLDGYVTYRSLKQGAESMPQASSAPRLDEELETFSQMVPGRDWTTHDALGLGGLLLDAARLSRTSEEEASSLDRNLIDELLASAERGLQRYLARRPLEAPAWRRLAFRELGLAIGLSRVAEVAPQGSTTARWEPLMGHLKLRGQIVAFWSSPDNRQADSWREHRDINDVMLASAIIAAQPYSSDSP